MAVAAVDATDADGFIIFFFSPSSFLCAFYLFLLGSFFAFSHVVCVCECE